MANNNFTQNYIDASPLTAAELNTAYQTLTLDLANTTQMTTGSTSGTVLTSQGSGQAATWSSPPDPLGPFAIRNYGLLASASNSVLKVYVKTNGGSNPSAGSPVDITFSTNGATTASYTNVQVTGALSFTVNASATLGMGSASTATQKIFVYALNNASTPILGVSSRPDFDNGSAVTTAVMNASAKSGSTMYATAALTVMPRLLGWVTAARNSSGNWTGPSAVNITNNSSLNIAATSEFNRASSTSGSATLAVLGSIAVSSTTGTLTISGGSFQQVKSVQLVTSGRPVRIELISDENAVNASNLTVGNSAGTATAGYLVIQRDGVTKAFVEFGYGNNALVNSTAPGIVYHVDFAPAGTHVYTLLATTTSASGTINIQYCKLIAYEI